MRLVFAGTPQFAERALERLLRSGHELTLVVTQPDRPAGRGMRAAPSAVKRLAAERGLPLYQPETLRSPQALERLRAAGGDALVVAAYGLLLPQAILGLAPLGALNIHASLLPRWRGAAPIQRALLAGDRETGISIMKMDAGLDTGPVVLQRALPIEATDDAGTLHDKLAALGAEAIVAALAELQSGARAQAQASAGVTHAPKIDKRELALDWSRPAVELERAVRAFRPAPGAVTRLAGGEPLKVWRSRVVPGGGAPGTVLATGSELVVACGTGALALLEVQLAGARRMPAGEFLRGRSVERGARLG